ncbi:hypothetical protein FSP39_016210 [Pinctada imbricata]|uniref:V-type proton ATPase subunit S1 n=1 Tax=Pinctada imbricata TaxID=66713 RepID=A0AA89CAZ4_PINIB|nr:hypothetical protein FSP39_016210 [Pinctada imbricata]
MRVESHIHSFVPTKSPDRRDYKGPSWVPTFMQLGYYIQVWWHLIKAIGMPLNDLPQSFVGNTIGTDEFTNQYLAPLVKSKANKVVVFLQDKLSLQDFNQYADVYNPDSDGGAFKNIKGYMDEHFSVNLPSVISPGKAITQLIKMFDGKVHQAKTVNDIGKLNLGEPSLIIVTLEPVHGSSNEEKVVAKNDQTVSEIVKHLNKRSIDYTALYTAENSQKEEEVVDSAKRRLLEFVQKANGTFLNSTCMFFWFREMTLIVTKDNQPSTVPLTSGNFTDQQSSCSNKTARLAFHYEDSNVTLDVEMDIVISNKTGYWFIQSNKVEANFTNNASLSGVSTLDMKSVAAPPDFSYHCSNLGPVISSNITGNDTANMTLIVNGFQLQPFNIMNGQFSDGWDCVPFFTAVIWSGIISVGLITIILIFGFAWIADMRTMDKFDDPKGKTISVNVGD